MLKRRLLTGHSCFYHVENRAVAQCLGEQWQTQRTRVRLRRGQFSGILTMRISTISLPPRASPGRLSFLKGVADGWLMQF